jgi:dolichol-phosphate mannosyltransferase
MKYSIVVPIYNDGYLAEAFCEESRRVFSGLLNTQSISEQMELIFVNDGSRNNSLQQLIDLCSRFDFVRVVDLSRNFGQHQAIACGFREAKGDIIVRSNVDMQDPLSELPKLIELIETNDVDLAVGQYAERQSPFIDKLTSGAYFALFRFLSGIDVPRHTSPLRAMSRRFINAYNQLTEKSRFPQGLDYWLGFHHALVPIEHRERADKKSSYTFTKRLKLALEGALYFSERPIQLMTVFGFILSTVGVLLGGWLLITKMLGVSYLPGYVSLAAIGLGAFGVQLSCMGIVGLYVGKIFKESQNRPLYIIRETYGGKTGK